MFTKSHEGEAGRIYRKEGVYEMGGIHFKERELRATLKGKRGMIG